MVPQGDYILTFQKKGAVCLRLVPCSVLSFSYLGPAKKVVFTMSTGFKPARKPLDHRKVSAFCVCHFQYSKLMFNFIERLFFAGIFADR